MAHPFMLIASLVALSVVYVVLPTFVMNFLEFGGTRRLRCPQTGIEAEVSLAAGRAALTELVGAPRLRVANCSLWPLWADCSRQCLKAYAQPGR